MIDFILNVNLKEKCKCDFDNNNYKEFAKKSIEGDFFSLSYYEDPQFSSNLYETEDEIIFFIGMIQKRNPNFNSKNIRYYAKDIKEIYLTNPSSYQNMIKGNYALIIIDRKNRYVRFHSSISGLYRLFYYRNEAEIFISTSIDNILSQSRLHYTLDYTAIMEYALFDFPLSDRTFINEIKIADNHTTYKYSQDDLTHSRYYDYRKHFANIGSLSWKETYAKTPNIFNTVMDGLLIDVDKCNSALTSGFDSRTTLSYFLAKKKESIDVNFFSWGVAKNFEIEIPKKIAKIAGISYNPVIFDSVFEESFSSNIDEYLNIGDGVNNLKRANQAYSHKKLSKLSRYMMTGYFGSEILRPLGSTGTITRPKLERVFNSKNKKKVLTALINEELQEGFLNRTQFSNIEELAKEINEDICDYLSTENDFEKRLDFVLKESFRRFFGQEIHSCRKYSIILSPYFDDDFVEFIIKTPVLELDRLLVNKKSKALRLGQMFYLPILETNSKILTTIKTGRLYSPKQLSSRLFPINIAFNYLYYRIKRKLGSFNTYSTKKWVKEYVIDNQAIVDSDESIIQSFENKEIDQEFYKMLSLKIFLMKIRKEEE